ncbi:MAG TPA: hypothetical protein P5287_07515 [bacterium]|nr:hypothetical protein [bacterium]
MSISGAAEESRPPVKIASAKAPVYFKDEVIGYVYKGAEIFIVGEAADLYRIRVWGGKSEFYGWMKRSDLDAAVDVPEVTADGMPEFTYTKTKTGELLTGILKVPYREKHVGSRSASKKAAGGRPSAKGTEKILKKYPVAGDQKPDGTGDLTLFEEWSGMKGNDFLVESKIDELEKLQKRADPAYFWPIKEYISALKELRDNKAGNFRNLYDSAEKRRSHME